jgi:hypothetical protein
MHDCIHNCCVFVDDRGKLALSPGSPISPPTFLKYLGMHAEIISMEVTHNIHGSTQVRYSLLRQKYITHGGMKHLL